jgi:arabinose-5-phosphate isomerase
VRATTTLDQTLLEMGSKGMGMTTVLDEQGKLLGVFTDGDLRRALDHKVDVHATIIGDIMTHKCITIHADILAAEALHIMEEHSITALVVLDDNRVPVGTLHLHDLLRAGVA